MKQFKYQRKINLRKIALDISNSRFGLDGSPAKTLEIIGQKYNVTRERIRQNESYGLRKLRFSKPITPILDKIFEILDQSLPITEIEFNRILKDKGLTNLEWDLKVYKIFMKVLVSSKIFIFQKLIISKLFQNLQLIMLLEK